MIDKSLVKRRFKKSLETYSDNAVVQKQMALKLIKLLPLKKFNSVFEIGCATGVLTEQICQQLRFKTLTVNDIVPESKKYTDKILDNYRFLTGDIETININDTYDLIISNACFQWCENIEQVISKLLRSLNKGGVLAFSVFGKNNLKELNDILEVTQKCYTKEELKSFFNTQKNTAIEEEQTELLFNSPIEVLQHLKLTGANAIKEYKFTKSALKNFETEYINNYTKNGKVYLTYHPIYTVFINK